MSGERIICQFSCGAASAVATKLVLASQRALMSEQHQLMVPRDAEVLIVNAFIKEEDDDNRRFLADCERWFGHPITVLRDEKYGASVAEVWRRERYMKGPFGAPCSTHLKRRLLDAFRLPGDMVIFGYTAEEKDRFDDFQERNPTIRMAAPLIDRGLTKNDCLAMIERAGIVLPLMYREGFENANCPRCPKGGEGYWNRIRIIRPRDFAETMAIQEDIGPGAYFFRHRDTGERFGLKDLSPTAGRHNEPSPSCSFFCEIAEQEITTPTACKSEESK